MEDRPSGRYEVVKLNELIKAYISNENNSCPRAELFSMTIEMEDLIPILDDLRNNMFLKKEEYLILKVSHEELTKDNSILEQEYEELNEKYTLLMKSLKSWVNDSLPVKVSNLIKKLEDNSF